MGVVCFEVGVLAIDEMNVGKIFCMRRHNTRRMQLWNDEMLEHTKRARSYEWDETRSAECSGGHTRCSDTRQDEVNFNPSSNILPVE